MARGFMISRISRGRSVYIYRWYSFALAIYTSQGGNPRVTTPPLLGIVLLVLCNAVTITIMSQWLSYRNVHALHILLLAGRLCNCLLCMSGCCVMAETHGNSSQCTVYMLRMMKQANCLCAQLSIDVESLQGWLLCPTPPPPRRLSS